MTSLASKVKFVRTKLKITQEELSLNTGIPVITISRWENGKCTKPQLKPYGKFLDYCNDKNITFDEQGRD